MEVLQIIAVILVLLLVVGLYLGICYWLNERCAQQEKMKPLNTGSLLAITLAASGIYVGGFMLLGDGGIPSWPWRESFLHSQAGNGLVIMVLGTIITLITYVTLIVKCSFWNGIFGSILLTIAGIFIALIVIMLVLALLILIFGSSERDQRRRY